MSDGLILAIDQGTTNTKAIAVDAVGQIVAHASTPMQVTYPHPGWAEQSAADIWQSVRTVIAQVAATATRSIDAVAISNQRESIVVWDGTTGEPIAPAVIWQCRRSAERCAALRRAGHNEQVVRRTGLALDPLFPAAKIAWILDSVPGARQRADRGELRAGTIDSWLLWNLTGGAVHATDHSNASRTQLFNTLSLEWDAVLGGLFDVPLSIMPRVMRSDSHFGDIAAGSTALPAGTPIRAMIGDSHAALFGHGVHTPGTVKATYGTGSSLMTLTPTRMGSRHGLSGTIAWSTLAGVAHALEGNISVSGQAAAFMAEMLGLKDAAALSVLASTVDDTNGIAFVPALVGLGAPHWRDDARGIVSGLSLGTKPAHLARAALEAIAFQVADVFTAMEGDLGVELDVLSVDGGASRNDFLMQFQADILNRRVTRGRIPELSALGAARMAFEGMGGSTSWSIAGPAIFSSAMSGSDRGAALNRWYVAVRQALA
ncbi:MAG: FGGY-family carbohydrate kinase [Devosia sp.]|nr:FGGY-family carbohydrate kinase [Devosia sp.]